MKKLLIILICLIIPCLAQAATHYVSPTGSATWANSTVAETPCSLATANSNATAGDTVILADGDYGTNLAPTHAGTAGSRLVFQAATKWGAIIKDPTPFITNRQNGILLNYSYITVDGIKVDGTTFTATGENHALWNSWSGVTGLEIKNCWFVGVMKSILAYATHSWIHDNLFDASGTCGAAPSCNTYGGGFMLGSTSAGQYGHAGNNTVEDNTMQYGGHHNLETFTWYNVIRNNHFHNEGNFTGPEGCTYGPDSNGKYGDRNIQIYDYAGSDGTFNLIEGNRFSASGAPSDDDGGDGFTLTAPKNILRYNSIVNSQNNGLLFKMGYNSSGNNNRVFNNTITYNGRYDNTGPQWQGYGIRFYSSTPPASGNVIKNNIIYSNTTGDIAHTDKGGVNTATANTFTKNHLNATGNPLFTDTTHTDLTSAVLPDLNLQSSSPAIDAGTYLTLANGAAAEATTTLVVDDSLYFQAGSAATTTPMGSSLSSVAGDFIKIGTNEAVQITDINHATNTITLASAQTWADNAEIRLYKKSDGVQVLYGNETDIGAYEYEASEEEPSYTVTVSKTGNGCSLSHDGEYTIFSGDTLNVAMTVNNGWKGAWSGTCPATGTDTRVCTPTDNQTMVYACEEIKLNTFCR